MCVFFLSRLIRFGFFFTKKLKTKQALASPETARSLAQALPLESTLAPILAAQRAALSGTDPADYPRAPVEIVLVSLTLIAQLGVTLTDNDVGACGGSGGGGGLAQRRHYGGKNVDCKVGYSSNINDTSLDDEEEDGKRGRKERRRRRRDAAGATRLRKFLGEQVATGEVKLCIGHAACRAESKDLARRVASLISLLQVLTDSKNINERGSFVGLGRGTGDGGVSMG